MPFCECAVCVEPEPEDFCDRMGLINLSNETNKERVFNIKLPPTFRLDGKEVEMAVTVIYPNNENTDGIINLVFDPNISPLLNLFWVDNEGNFLRKYSEKERLGKGDYNLKIQLKSNENIYKIYCFTLTEKLDKILIEQASFGKENGRAKVVLDNNKNEDKFTFEWTKSDSNSAEANNLGAGNYSVVITSKDQPECTHTIPFTINDEQGKYIPCADPYSFWVTILLPGWTKKYRDYEFRKYFYDLIIKEAPAHIAFRLVWLSPKDMCKVENQYIDWRKCLANKSCDTSNTRNELCEMVECLSTLSDMPPCPVETENVNLCADKDTQKIRIHKASLFTSLLFNKYTDFDTVSQVFPDFIGSTSNYFTLPTISFPTIFNPITFQPPPTLTAETDPSSPIGAVVNAIPKQVNIPNNSKRKKNKSKKPSAKKVQLIKDWQGPRRLKYIANIKAIETKQLAKTSSYKKVTAFLKTTNPDITAYEKLVDYIIRYAIKRKGGTSNEHYFVLIHNATAHLLDQLIVTDTNKLQYKEQLTACLEKQKAVQADFQILLDFWQSKALKKITKAKVINAYQELIKTIVL